MNKLSPYNLIRSFGYALRGIYYALTRERNLRIHVAAGAFVLFFSRYYALSRVELALLALTIGLVITCEMVNTAIEKAIDLKTPSYHYLAGIAKDVAAGSVLVSAITSVVVGFLLLWDVPTLSRIGADLLAHPLYAALAAAAALLWIIFPKRRKRT